MVKNVIIGVLKMLQNFVRIPNKNNCFLPQEMEISTLLVYTFRFQETKQNKTKQNKAKQKPLRIQNCINHKYVGFFRERVFFFF